MKKDQINICPVCGSLTLLSLEEAEKMHKDMEK